MKKTNLLLLVAAMFLAGAERAQAQGMAVNTTGSAAAASAMLDVSSTSKGVLIPRMTNANMTSISSPATGLLVFCTDCTPAGFNYYTGSAWTALGGGAPSGAAGGGLSGSYPNPTIATGAVGLTNLSATGTASTTTFLRGDNSWSTAVTSVSSGNLSPLFTTAVSNATTTPTIAYTLSNSAAYTVLTNSTNATSTPSYGKVVPLAMFASSGTPSSTTFYRGDGTWAAPAVSSTHIFAGGFATGAAATQYSPFPGGAATSTTNIVYGVPMPTAITITQFYLTGTVRLTGVANATTVTLYKNGSATAFTLTLNTTGAESVGNQVSNNMSGSLSVAAGDELSLRTDISSSGTGVIMNIGVSFLAN